MPKINQGEYKMTFDIGEEVKLKESGVVSEIENLTLWEYGVYKYKLKKVAGWHPVEELELVRSE